ncbi:MAG: amidase [Nitriliruptoraceae bacterium]
MRNAEQTVEHNLAQIAAHDEILKATITVCADNARAEAKTTDQAAANGQWLGLLHGVTVALKDNIDTAGVRTTSGSKFFTDHVPTTDAPVVEKLKAAGAIVISKTNMAEFAIGGTTQNEHYGSCRNPWNTDHIPGGSSGGSGAAVATEMAMAALGTDTGGSVRLPACINGLVGMKPTTGRVSNRAVTPMSLWFDTVGPMAYSAETVARMLAVIEGYDPLDTSAIDGPGDEIIRGLHEGIEGVRIGMPTSYFFDDVDPEILARVRDAIEVLASLGAEIVNVDVPRFSEAQERMTKMLYPDVLAFHAERLATQPEVFGSDVRTRLQIGKDIPAEEFARSVQWRAGWIQQLKHTTFADVDLVVTPTLKIQTPPVDSDALKTGSQPLAAITHKLGLNTFGWSFAGNPGVSVPVGQVNGLPVGMQLVGPWWHDGAVLRAAVAYQSVTAWHRNRPALVG